MKKTDKGIDELIEKFGSSKRATVKPFFYERLERKLSSKHSQVFELPALRFQLAMLLLLASLNIASLVFLKLNSKSPLEQDVAAVIELYDLRTYGEDSE